jgi:hypothetical protein
MGELVIERQIRKVAVMIGAGLLLQFFTLWVHPLAFVVFLAAGCPLVAAGVILYLWSLVTPQSHFFTRGHSSSMDCLRPRQ